MKLFGFNITRTKAAPPPVPVAENRGGWVNIIRESFTGAWQQNVTVDYNTVLSYHAVYACITLIAADISKLRVKLVEYDEAAGVWTETTSSAFSPVLRKPNRYQTRNQFWEAWALSKLCRGNTYVLKARDGRGIVVALYVLDPNRVKTLVSDDGSVWYQLSSDNMAGGELVEDVMVPASEMIHDRFNCLFHPLIGTSPLYAAGVTATQGLAIQTNSSRFFANQSRPGGVLTAPGEISQLVAERLKADWEAKFSGENAGRIAVLGDGLTFQAMTMTAEESQLIEQQKWTAEVICSTFHVPPYKIGIGQMPTYNNIQALNVGYYSECLQKLYEDAEACLDEGLGIGAGVRLTDGKILGTEFDIDNLLRMDSVTQVTSLKEAVSAAIYSPDEARKKLDLKPVEGGSSPYLQEQNFSLAALSKRDALENPWAGRTAPVPPEKPKVKDDDSVDDKHIEDYAFAALTKALPGNDEALSIMLQ